MWYKSGFIQKKFRYIPSITTSRTVLDTSLKKFFSLRCVFSEDSSQENGASTNQYNSISPPASPVAQEEPFNTYFEQKVAIPDDVSPVSGKSQIFMGSMKHSSSNWAFQFRDLNLVAAI